MEKICEEPILIVDDIEVNIMLLKSYVQKSYSNIYTAKNGIEAYDFAKNIKFICIIMDIQMPIVNGMDATELIRKRDDSINKDTPILGITATSRVNYELQCLERGMNSVLYKPVTRDIVLEEIKKCITGNLYSEPELKSQIDEQLLDSGKHLPFEYKRALNEFAGDEELLNMAVNQFANDLSDQIIEMERAIKVKNFEVVHKIAHKIRGAAANITAVPISEMAGLIEENDESEEQFQLDNQMFLLSERVEEFFKNIKQLKLDIQGNKL